MRRVTLCTFGILVIFVLAMSPGSECSRRRILIAKKLAALMLLNKKRYIFVAPFPLPVPLPVITKVKHIVHKEKVPVPVPVPHHVTKYVAVPVPVPEKSWSDESWKTPDVSASEISYKISEKPHHPKHLEKIYAESTQSLRYAEKPTYSETPIKISDKSYLDGSYKIPMDKTYNLDEFEDHFPKRLYQEDLKFDLKDLKDYAAAGSSIHEQAIELPKKLRDQHHHLSGGESFKFPENAFSEEMLSKLSGDLTAAASGNTEFLHEAPELSAASENQAIFPVGEMIAKKKK